MTGGGNRSQWGLCGVRNAVARPCVNALDFGTATWTCAERGCLLQALGDDQVIAWLREQQPADDIPRQRGNRPRQ